MRGRGVAWGGALVHARHLKKRKDVNKNIIYILYCLFFLLKLLYLQLILSNIQKVKRNFEYQIYKTHHSGAWFLLRTTDYENFNINFFPQIFKLHKNLDLKRS